MTIMLRSFLFHRFDIMQPLLTIEDLSVDFISGLGTTHALKNISLQVNRGEILAIVGESGSGKSVPLYRSSNYSHPLPQNMFQVIFFLPKMAMSLLIYCKKIAMHFRPSV